MKVKLNKQLILEDVYHLGVGDSMDNLPKMIDGTKHLLSVGAHKVIDPVNHQINKIQQNLHNTSGKIAPVDHSHDGDYSDGEGHIRNVHDLDNTGGI